MFPIVRRTSCGAYLPLGLHCSGSICSCPAAPPGLNDGCTVDVFKFYDPSLDAYHTSCATKHRAISAPGFLRWALWALQVVLARKDVMASLHAVNL